MGRKRHRCPSDFTERTPSLLATASRCLEAEAEAEEVEIWCYGLLEFFRGSVGLSFS